MLDINYLNNYSIILWVPWIITQIVAYCGVWLTSISNLSNLSLVQSLKSNVKVTTHHGKKNKVYQAYKSLENFINKMKLNATKNIRCRGK